MKKKVGWISAFAIIGVCFFIIMLFTNSVTAGIPTASSFAPAFKDWSVHFSEQMNPETFTNRTVIVTDEHGEEIPLSFVWNQENTVLTLKAPSEGYTIDQSYKIKITDEVETAKGKKLSKSFTHSFQAVAQLPKIKNKKQLVTLLKERMKQSYGQEESSGAEMDMAAESNDSAKSSGDGGSSTSTTNVQVAGIDESDIIKTDGNFIYFARDNDIIITSTEKENSKVITKIEAKDFHPTELYLHENLLISIGYSYETIRNEKEKSTDIGVGLPYFSSQTTVNIYDISNKMNPEKVREVTLEGFLTATRKMDDHLYLIANDYPPYHILENSKAEIRPFVKDTAISDKAEPIDFDHMYFFPDSDENSFLLITSINLKDMKKEAIVESYLGASEQMYMSENHIYVAVNKYNKEKTESKSNGSVETTIWRPGNMDTEITQFKIDDGDITYNASTVVNGTLINQFAMDEQRGTFRVATTAGDFWQDDKPSTNNLYTFDINLNPLGSLEGLAEGERIFSVRFMEDVAYMVTFEQVDPLFVIDLKDPKKPNVLGELKIPGFSNYLHPLDNDHVIGFGEHTKLVSVRGSKEPQVQMEGIKIALFDVSDLTNPKEIDSEILGKGGSYTELNHNHKALYKHPSENIFGFPATLFETKTIQQGDATYEDYSFVYEGAFLYSITPENGIALKDTITHQKDPAGEYPEWESEIKRLVSVDDVIYTLSYDQMKVYDMNESTIMKQIELPKIKLDY